MWWSVLRARSCEKLFDFAQVLWYKTRLPAGIARIFRLSRSLYSRDKLPARAENQKFVRGYIMSRVCQVTGKKPMAGNNVSHAQNKTRRRFVPNLHSHRFWVESEKRFVKLRVSTKGLRIIDKHGIEKVLADLRDRGEKV